jgi:Mg-chelatase subunit ChlI
VKKFKLKEMKKIEANLNEKNFNGLILPIGATEEKVCGTIDTEKFPNRRCFEPGH